MKLLLAILIASAVVSAKPRARELGIPFEGTPGKNNSITDVVGVEVGHVTLIQGKGKLQIGKGPVRTGVTAILPQGKNSTDFLFAGWNSLNGNGELTGTTWLKEGGFLEGPILLTNTHSVGTVHNAVTAWRIQKKKPDEAVSLPVVGETWDGYLNDINGFHVTQKHAIEAIEKASTTNLEEGSVGGGTGMICFEYKCGIGTSSRLVQTSLGKYAVGVLVQANFGRRHQLQLAGIPVGKEFNNDLLFSKETGSILGIVATDAPLLPHQLERIARRAGLGIARLGAVSGDGSGDIFLAFSTATSVPRETKRLVSVKMFPNSEMDPFFEATVHAIEEAVVNSMVAADTMIGVDNHKATAVPLDQVLPFLAAHKRLTAK